MSTSIIEVAFWVILIFVVPLIALLISMRKGSTTIDEIDNEPSVDYRAIKRGERDRQLREWQREYNRLLGIEPENYLEGLLYRGDDGLIRNTLMLKRQMKFHRDYENERMWNEH